MYDGEGDGAGIGIGFDIEFGNSFGELKTLDDLVGAGAANMIRQMQRMEQSIGMPISKFQELSRATQENAKSQRDLTRERNLAERSGDKLSAQLTRDIANYGKSRAEIKRNTFETAALRSEQAGLTVQAGELRQQLAQLDALHAASASAAALEAQAIRGAANAHIAFEAAARRGMQAMRDQEAAAAALVREEQQLAIAADRLRGSIDPSFAAQQRFNREIEEAQRLVSRSAISLDDYTAKLRMERAALDDASAAQGRAAASVGAHRSAMQGLSFQAQDAFTSISMGANPLSVLAIQGGQAAGQMAFLGGRLGAVANFLIGPWGLAMTGGLLLLGSLTKGMFDSAAAAKDAQFATSALGDAQNILGGVMDLTTGKINTQSGALHALAQAQLLVARVQAQSRAAEAKRGIQAMQDRALVFDGGFGGGINIHRRERDGRDVISQGMLAGTLQAKKAVEQLDQLRRIGRMSEEDWLAATMAVANYGVELENIKTFTAGDRLLNGNGTAGDRSLLLKPDRANASAAKAKGLSDEQKALESATKAARDYAAAQTDEAAKLGLSAKELRLYADAAALAKAPTDALKKSIVDAAAVRERAYAVDSAKDFEASVMKPLRDELALYGLTGPARAAAALDLEKQGFMARFAGEGFKVAEERWKAYSDAQRALIDKEAGAALEVVRIKEMNDALGATAEKWDLIARNVDNAARGMSDAFGSVGGALGDLAGVYANFEANRARGHSEHMQRLSELKLQADKDRENARFALSNSTAQIGLYGDMTQAAKGMFKEKSAGWRALGIAEKAFRAIEFAMSVQAMVQNAAETMGFVANSAAKATAAGAEGIANQAKLPFPYNIAAMAATGVALVAAGIAVAGGLGGGGKATAPETNKGTGTVFGDPTAQSESIRRAIDSLAEIDTLMLSYSRQMAASLRTIESSIGGFANLLVRNAESINASGGVTEGFKTNAIGSVLSKIPVIGGILGGLFGSKTTVLANGLYGGAQSIGDILGGGFQADYFTDIQKKKKLFGFTTSNKTSTQYANADPMLENQFTLLIKQFNDAIVSAAGPLGSTATDIQQRLNGLTLSLGRIDLKGLTGAEIEERLTAVFGAAADSMAAAAFPFITEFQKVGEGAFETLVRVSATIEAVGSTLDMLGQSAQGMGIAAKLGLAEQFESVSALTSAVDGYFAAFYTKEEQAAARTAQMGQVFQSLGMAMPGTLAAFRALVEAQNLNTAAGRETYATLLKLAPAFADLQSAMDGAKSAADIASEKMDLQRQLLELNGDTAALRALQLAKLDASNRALQEQIWAIQDANAAAKAADELRKAWQGVGDSIFDEVQRIRGLTAAGAGNSFASLQGQFNAATGSARAGDMDAAKSLPGLSKALLDAAADAATSRQELDRIRAQTAAALEATYGLIGSLSGNPAANSPAALLSAGAASQPAASAINDNTETIAARLDALADRVEQMRAENTAALTTIAGNTGRTARKLDDVTAQSGGDAISTVRAA